MRLNVAIFFGALFGALGVLLFLVAFGSDYWLLATEVGRCSGEQNVRFSFKLSLLRAALGTVLKSSQGWGIYFFIEELCRDLVVIIIGDHRHSRLDDTLGVDSSSLVFCADREHHFSPRRILLEVLVQWHRGRQQLQHLEVLVQ